MKHISLLRMILPEAFSSLRLESSYTSFLMKESCKFTTEADTKMLIPITNQDVYIIITAKIEDYLYVIILREGIQIRSII